VDSVESDRTKKLFPVPTDAKNLPVDQTHVVEQINPGRQIKPPGQLPCLENLAMEAKHGFYSFIGSKALVIFLFGMFILIVVLLCYLFRNRKTKDDDDYEFIV
jgi:hypothetical protein